MTNAMSSTFLGFDRNEYGTPVSCHRCEACGTEFTLCPARRTWRLGCMRGGEYLDRDGVWRYSTSQETCTTYRTDADVVHLLHSGCKLTKAAVN